MSTMDFIWNDIELVGLGGEMRENNLISRKDAKYAKEKQA